MQRISVVDRGWAHRVQVGIGRKGLGILDGDGVPHVKGDHFPVLSGGERVEDFLALNADEVVGVALNDGGTDLGYLSLCLSLGQQFHLGDALLVQQLDIALLTGGDGSPGGYNLILGHVDHGVGLHQVGGVLQRNKVGGLPGDIQQDGEGSGIPQVLNHALGGGHGGVLGGARGGVEVGLFGALVGEQEAQV